MAAYCAAAGAHSRVYWWILSMAASSSGGAHTKPMRQPVMANAFEKPLMTTVRSNMPGSDATETCLPP